MFGVLQKSGSKSTLEDLQTIPTGAMSQKTKDPAPPSQFPELHQPPDLSSSSSSAARMVKGATLGACRASLHKHCCTTRFQRGNRTLEKGHVHKSRHSCADFTALLCPRAGFSSGQFTSCEVLVWKLGWVLWEGAVIQSPAGISHPLGAQAGSGAAGEGSGVCCGSP